jgi:transcriptional regulator with XRE-family HTH domain
MNKTARAFAKLFEKSCKRLEYFVQGAIIEFTESVFSRMEELKVSKAELADRLKCKPSYITKALSGGTNFTLESMVKISLALDCELTPIRLTPKTSPEKLSDIMKRERKSTFGWRLQQSTFKTFEYTVGPSVQASKPNNRDIASADNSELALAA